MDIPYIHSRSFFTLLTQAEKTKKHAILDMTETYSYLLNSIGLLLKLDIVHFDFK